LDEAFVPKWEPGAEVVVIQRGMDGRLLIAGRSASQNRAIVAVLEEDGGVDRGFVLDDNFPAERVWGAVTDRMGNVVVGGPILTNGVWKGYVRRLKPNGTLDPAFKAPTLDGMVDRLLALGDSLYVGLLSPMLTPAAGLPITLVRLQADGLLSSDLPMFLGDPVTALFADAKSRLLVGTSRQLFRSGLGQGSAGDFSTLTDGAVYAIGEELDGRLVIGGGFRAVTEIRRPGVAQLFGADYAPRPVLAGPTLSRQGFRVSFPTVAGAGYRLLCSEALGGDWTELDICIGDGNRQYLADPRIDRRQRFYQVRVE
jgi:hypothetical protein